MSIVNASIYVERGGPKGLSKPIIVQTFIDPKSLKPGQILFRVEKFGFSANNITYGLLGDNPHFQYYDFYPAEQTFNTSPRSHGIIPVWGFGTVVESRHDTIKPGQRLYGYVGMSRYLILDLDKQTNKYTVNISLGNFPPDRRPYKQLTICDNDLQYRADREDETMLYRPLFWTAYWFEDQLNEKKYHGAQNILLSSASSKTAFTIAYNIGLRRKRSGGSLNVKIYGLTSSSNAQFTRNLGLYDNVLTYDEISKASAPGSWLYVDLSGNASINAAIERQISPVLTVALGMTSVEQGNPSKLQGASESTARKEFFFMPEWLAIRVKELSPARIVEMQKTAWAGLMEDCSKWVKIDKSYGKKGVFDAYLKTLKGAVGPDKGQVFSLWEFESDIKLIPKL